MDDVASYAREGIRQIHPESRAHKDEQHEAERVWWELRDREGRDTMAEETRLIKRLYNFIQSQPTPWNLLDLVEAAEHEFPLTSALHLRVIISSLLIGLRLGVNELMDLSMADGPRKDSQGVLLINVNRACVTRFNSST